MPGPWERYQQAAPADASVAGPWVKYQSATPTTPLAAPTVTPPADPNAEINLFEGQMEAPFTVPANQPAATPAPTAPQSSFLRDLRIGSQGAGAGLAELAGLPVDLSEGVLNLGSAGAEKAVNWMLPEGSEIKLPRFSGSLGSSAFIKDLASDAATAAGVPPIDEADMSKGERLGYNVNRLVAQSVPGGGALARVAQTAKPGTIVHSMSAPYREAVDNAATMPGPVRAEIEAAKPLITDAASGAGAGAALTASQQFFPDSPIADMAATLLGGYGGASAATLGRVPSTTARSLFDRLPDADVAPDPVTGKSVSRRTADQAARYAQAQASDPEAAAARIGERAAEARYELEPAPTSGIASGDIGLIAGERGARLRDPVPFQERDQALKNAAEARVTGIRDPYAEPRAAQRFVEQDVATQRETAARPVAEARDELAATQAESARRIGEAEARREGELTARQQDITARQGAARTAEEAERELGGTVAARRTGDVAASERVAEAVGSAKQADEARKSGLYREAESLGRSTRIDPTGLADDAQAIRDEIGPLAGQNESLNNVLRDLDRLAPAPTKDVPEPEIQEISATDLIAMTPRLSQARDAAKRLMRGDVVERLDRVTANIKGKLDDLAEQGDAAALKWREAEANFRDDFAPKYREGVGAQLDKAERAKTPVPPTQVAGRFLGGGKEAAEDLNRILRGASSETEGQSAARDFVLADMAKVVGADGKIQPSRLRAWMANREGLFQAMPNLRSDADKVLRDVVNGRAATTELQRELEKAVGARRDADVKLRKEINAIKNDNRLSETQKQGKLADLERQAADVERDIQKSATSLLLDADPADAAKRVFSQRDPEKAMREIVAKVSGDKEAAAGWKRAVADHLIDRVSGTNTALSVGDDGPTSIAALKRFFSKNEKTLAAVFSPAEMQSLRRAHKILEPLGNLSRQATAGSPTVENKMLWNSVEAGLLTVTGNAITTGMIMKRIRTVLKFLPNQAEQVEHLAKRMYFDPELAQHLLTRNVKEVGSTPWNGKLVRLLAAGEAAREINDNDQD